jgi:hypothetical protein
MTTAPADPVADDVIVDTLRECIARGERDLLDGGVPTVVLADHLEATQATLSDRCSTLADAGRLVQVHGVAPADATKSPDQPRARPSYLPADHPDAPGQSGESFGGPPGRPGGVSD